MSGTSATLVGNGIMAAYGAKAGALFTKEWNAMPGL